MPRSEMPTVAVPLDEAIDATPTPVPDLSAPKTAVHIRFAQCVYAPPGRYASGLRRTPLSITSKCK